jgi:hypothetical protein
METVPKINPPGVEALPKQCAAKFEEIPERTVSLIWHRVPVDIYPTENFVARRLAPALGTQYGDVVTVRAQGQGFPSAPASQKGTGRFSTMIRAQSGEFATEIKSRLLCEPQSRAKQNQKTSQKPSHKSLRKSSLLVRNPNS